MCCTIKMAGIFAGIEHSTSLMASVPPVEAPISTSFSCKTRSEKPPGLPRGASKGSCNKGFGAIAGFTGTLGRALYAALTFSQISTRQASMLAAESILGLGRKSTAPNSSACRVASEPLRVRLEIITTGIGRSRIRRARKSRPSILGISMSSVSTSGASVLIISRAAMGSGATPTTSRSGAELMTSLKRLRIKAESSTMRTLIAMFSFQSGTGPAAPVNQRVRRHPAHCRVEAGLDIRAHAR